MKKLIQFFKDYKNLLPYVFKSLVLILILFFVIKTQINLQKGEISPVFKLFFD